MQKDELVLSDVHLQVKNDKSIDYCVSRFYYTEEIYGDRKKKCVVNSEESVPTACKDGNNLSVKLTENKEFCFTEIHSDDQERKRTSVQVTESKEPDSKQSKPKKLEIKWTSTKTEELGDQTSGSGGRSRSDKPEKSDIKWTSTTTEELGDQTSGARGCSRSDKPENYGIKWTSTKTEKVDAQTSGPGSCSRSDNAVKSTISVDKDRTSDVHIKTDCDEDGDFITKRRKRKHDNFSVITIAHKLQTNLENVGLQIWLASLYMADFIVNNKDTFTEKRVLDLGAGVGLTSIVAALYADHVICTDIHKGILDLAQHNLDINNTKEYVNFSVKEMDWFDSKFIPDDENEDCYKELKSEKDLMTCNIVISADVFYDDDITDALFRTVYGLMINTKIDTWYISLEKRYMFTIGDLDVTCPAYRHFRKCLNQLEEMSDDVLFTVCLVQDVQQCFQYDRTKQLEVWKVTSKRKKTDEVC